MESQDGGRNGNEGQIWDVSWAMASYLFFKACKIRTVDVSGTSCVVSSERAVTDKVGGEEMLKCCLGRSSKLPKKGFSRVHSFNLTTSKGGKIGWDSVDETIACVAGVRMNGGSSVEIIETRAKFMKAHDGAILAMNKDSCFFVCVHGDTADLPNSTEGKDVGKGLRIEPNCTEVR